MPSEATSAVFTARCYCGASRLRLDRAPLTAAYCHCRDCRRWTGAPVGAFAAFLPAALSADPPLGAGISLAPGVRRWNCPTCGSPLAARFDYLPRQVFIPLGIIDQADQIAPQNHCHAAAALPWLHLSDDLPRDASSARERLNATRKDLINGAEG